MQTKTQILKQSRSSFQQTNPKLVPFTLTKVNANQLFKKSQDDLDGAVTIT